MLDCAILLTMTSAGTIFPAGSEPGTRRDFAGIRRVRGTSCGHSEVSQVRCVPELRRADPAESPRGGTGRTITSVTSYHLIPVESLDSAGIGHVRRIYEDGFPPHLSSSFESITSGRQPGELALALTGDARNTDPACYKSPHHERIAAMAMAESESGDGVLRWRSYKADKVEA